MRLTTAVRTTSGPHSRPASPGAPVLLLLHGYGSHERDLAGLAPHLPAGHEVVSVQAPLQIGPTAYAWFPLAEPGLPDPATVTQATEALLAWIDAELPGRTVVPVGFSQGGLMVTQLMRHRPGAFPAGVVLAGFTLAAELPGDGALATTPVLYARGDADAIITSATVERTTAWLRAHVNVTEHLYEGLGHGVSPEMLADVTSFLVRVAPAA
ncbi:alpha/beta hydrolase [Sanguibacter sp. A247]|uniref:alpha/beta hydrolase n=1 Tax=unclassified Sanguibacter TaxID=2645534 RepID=UPI003FD783FB